MDRNLKGGKVLVSVRKMQGGRVLAIVEMKRGKVLVSAREMEGECWQVWR